MTVKSVVRNAIVWLMAVVFLALSSMSHTTDVELSVTYDASGVVLSWLAGPAEPQVFKVWRATLPDMSDKTNIATVFGTSFTDTTASGTIYFYQIERSNE